MSERDVEVFVDLAGEAIPAGRLIMRVLRERESATFTYHQGWLSHPHRFALDPSALPLGRGAFHTGGPRALFAGLSDSAPDRWGRTLMARQARLEGRRGALFEHDYLLTVDDLARQGALRFRDAGGGPFLAAAEPSIPPLVRLGELLAASDRVQQESTDLEALRLLLAPGSSLGGARPKASVVDPSGRLLIAKFPSVSDDWPVIHWEHVVHRLAAAAGVRVPVTRLERVGERAVLLVERFDRQGPRRIPYLSAMAMLGATEGEQDRSYLEIADAIRVYGSRVEEDLRELWRRMVFGVLVTNTDDHLRNHGFLRSARGWVLSPAFDLNPIPTDVRPRIHALALDDQSPRSSLQTLLDVAGYMGLDPADAEEIVGQAARATSGWRRAARAVGLDRAQVERMASAFEHADLDLALRVATGLP
ncbi:MAG: type II toxin-antitoxin system HipA family toxin [bacterium]